MKTTITVIMLRPDGEPPQWISYWSGHSNGASGDVAQFPKDLAKQWREGLEWVDAITAAITTAIEADLAPGKVQVVDLPDHVSRKLEGGKWPVYFVAWPDRLGQLVVDYHIDVVGFVPTKRERAMFQERAASVPKKDALAMGLSSSFTRCMLPSD